MSDLFVGFSLGNIEKQLFNFTQINAQKNADVIVFSFNQPFF
jgi:hypothetical protein